MLPEMNEASRWRVDLARDLSEHYSSHDEVVMLCLGGSASKGISDAYSDLDLIVYWNIIDEEWIQSSPLEKSLGLQRTDIISLAPGTFIESYHTGGLKIDFGHVTMKAWEGWVDHLEADPDQMGMIGGFLSNIPLYGKELFEKWKTRLSIYPPEIAMEIVQKNLGFFVNGYLLHQCYERGDYLAYTDGMTAALKKIISATAAMNGYFYSAAEPRWIDYTLSRMDRVPAELTSANIKWMLENPGEKAVSMLYSIQEDVLKRAARQFPELEEKIDRRLMRMEQLGVHPCQSRPELQGRV